MGSNIGRHLEMLFHNERFMVTELLNVIFKSEERKFCAKWSLVAKVVQISATEVSKGQTSYHTAIQIRAKFFEVA